MTSWPVDTEIEGLSLKDQVTDTVRGLQTRSIYVVKPQRPPEDITAEELNEKPERLNSLLERIEGEGGWVRIIKFNHE